MKANLARLDWGVFFVVLGAVLLAVNGGLVDRSTVANLASLWPVVLIVIGIGLILRFGRAQAVGGVAIAASFGLIFGALIGGGISTPIGLACTATNAGATAVTANGTFTQGGRISAELSCVDLTLDGQPGTGWAVSAGSDATRQPRIDQSANSLSLRSEPERFFGPGPKLAWHVTVPQQTPVSLDLTTNAAGGKVSPGPAQMGPLSFTLNASDVDFNLRDVTALPSFSGTLNASSSTLVLPAAANGLNGSITLNASSLTVCAAPSMNLQFQLSETLSGNNFAGAGLEKTGDRWITPGAFPGVMPTTINLSTNVSSVTLDRSGGCQ